jgi:hypothetical protein
MTVYRNGRGKTSHIINLGARLIVYRDSVVGRYSVYVTGSEALSALC